MLPETLKSILCQNVKLTEQKTALYHGAYLIVNSIVLSHFSCIYNIIFPMCHFIDFIHIYFTMYNPIYDCNKYIQYIYNTVQIKNFEDDMLAE